MKEYSVVLSEDDIYLLEDILKREYKDESMHYEANCDSFDFQGRNFKMLHLINIIERSKNLRESESI